MKRVTAFAAPMPAGYPPISTAGTAFGEQPHSQVEYMARRFDSNGIPEYCLVKDPCSWPVEERKPGIFYVVRPTPRPSDGFSASREVDQQIDFGEF